MLKECLQNIQKEAISQYFLGFIDKMPKYSLAYILLHELRMPTGSKFGPKGKNRFVSHCRPF